MTGFALGERLGRRRVLAAGLLALWEIVGARGRAASGRTIAIAFRLRSGHE
jgi:hypothetical protein